MMGRHRTPRAVTTFSTFALEVVTLALRNDNALAAVYIIASVACRHHGVIVDELAFG
jgi:fluoride ion exporter CrcB/FEX